MDRIDEVIGLLEKLVELQREGLHELQGLADDRALRDARCERCGALARPLELSEPAK